MSLGPENPARPLSCRERAALASAASRLARRGASAGSRIPHVPSLPAGSWRAPVLSVAPSPIVPAASPRVDDALSWGSLPAGVRSALAAVGWYSLSDVRKAEHAHFVRATQDCMQVRALKPWLTFIRGETGSSALDSLAAELSLATQVPDAVCDYIGIPPEKRRRGSFSAPPKEQVKALALASEQGVNVLDIVDALLTKKIKASVERSMEKYISAARTAEAFCSIANVPFLPTTPQTVYRFAAIITHEGTLRSILAAWRKFHHLAGYHWPVEHSPVLTDIRSGARKLQAPPPPRPRIRKDTLRSLLQHCVKTGIFSAECHTCWHMRSY